MSTSTAPALLDNLKTCAVVIVNYFVARWNTRECSQLWDLTTDALTNQLIGGVSVIASYKCNSTGCPARPLTSNIPKSGPQSHHDDTSHRLFQPLGLWTRYRKALKHCTCTRYPGGLTLHTIQTSKG